MSIKVKESTMVCPAEETPRQSLWLSRIDMMIRQPYSHTNLILIYQPNEGQKLTSSSSSTFFDAEILKSSLSKALVPFYPMAGRLKINESNGRYEIDCNAEGALFVTAETTHKLADFGDFRPSAELHQLLIPKCDFSKGLSSFPLLIFQLTHFKCGGVCLAYATHHHLVDGASHSQFMNSWARIARGLDVTVMPVHDRATYLAPRHPPQVKFRHLEYEPPLPPLPPKGLSGEKASITECLFKLSKDQVNALKQQTSSQEMLRYKLSTFETLAGHVWRSACKARRLAENQDVKLYMHTNGRSRLKNPALPKGYCGNVIFFASCIAKAGDIVDKPLWYTSDMIHAAVKKLDNVEYLRSAIDYLESQSDFTGLVRGPRFITCPNISINFWGKMPLHEADFGWGGAKFAGLTEVIGEGQTIIKSSPNEDGSFIVYINLFTSHVSLFEKYLYNFAIPNKL